MVDAETIGKKIDEKAEKVEEKIDESKEKFEAKKEEQKEKYEERKEQFDAKKEERKEKSKKIADNVITELYKTVDDIKESVRNMQKSADEKYSNYKKSTVQTIDVDFIETKDVYYIKAAVPGVDKDDVLVEAGDNDVRIEVDFSAYIDEFEEDETAEVISSTLKSGKCVKTIRFENSIDIENITAKFDKGIVIIELPKLIIPKHKINVE